MKRTCRQCGETFDAAPYRARKGGAKFCCNRCYADARRRSKKELFWDNVSIGPECWNWQGTILSTGYGQLNASGEKLAAHRLGYEIQVGSIPEGMYVCHHCDTPSCVRGDHLFLGTAADNLRDAQRKGRRSTVRGENTNTAKLTEEDVRKIRELCEDGVSSTDIAKEYSVSRSAISSIKSRRSWAWL